MMNNHRYPLRAGQSEQLLQKRTKHSMNPHKMVEATKDKRLPNEQFNPINQENSSSFANKKVRKDLSGRHQQQHPSMKQAGYIQGKSSEMKLKKTNPRLASMKGAFANEPPMMNQRKGKQLKKMENKEQQHQYMQYPMHMPQYPMQSAFPAMQSQMMPMGMQFPMQQTNPHMSFNGTYQTMNPQIAEMQKQINLLSQMTMMQSQMQQMQHHDHNMYPKQNHNQMSEFAGHPPMPQGQFPGSYYPQQDQSYNGIYGQMPSGFPRMQSGQREQDSSQEQEEYYEEEDDNQNFSQHSNDDMNENQIDRPDFGVKQSKNSKKAPPTRGLKEVSKQASPSYGKKRADSDSKNRTKPYSPSRSKRQNSGENVQSQQTKKAANQQERMRVETNESQKDKPQNLKATPKNLKKTKLVDVHDNKNIIDDGLSVRRTTRSMLNKSAQKKMRAQAYQDSPRKQATPTQVKQSTQAQNQKSNSRSPKNSPMKGHASKKQAKVNVQQLGSQDESSQQVTQRETRYSSRLSSAKVSSNVITDKQKVLQSLKDEIEAANFNQRELLNKKNSIKQNSRLSSAGRPDSSERRQTRAQAAKKTPTKDEMILFGNQSQRSHQEKSNNANQKSNPLLKRHRKEAQTEIVDRRYEEDMQKQINGSKSVYENETDEQQADEELRMVSDLQKQKDRLQQELNLNIMDEQKLKDMSILFGIPEEEVQAIQKEQQAQIQRQKDQLLLFGDEAQTGEVNEFSTQNPMNVKNEAVKSESHCSEVKMTGIIADNGVIDVDHEQQIKTEQDEMLLFNDNSTTQDLQQRLVKDEMHQLTGKDINIILEVQKPVESSSQDLKIKDQPVKQSKLTIEDERMLFSDEPLNVTAPQQKSTIPQASTDNANQINSTSIQMNTVTHNQQISSSNQLQSSSRENLINGENIAQEPDDTFKIDEQAHQNQIRNSMLSGMEVQDRYEPSKKSDQIDAMQLQQENLKKQIELLQQQIDKDQVKIKEQNIIMSAQKEKKQLIIKKQQEYQNQVQQAFDKMEEDNLQAVHDEQNGDDTEEIQEENNDQIMQDHDGREFEVQLEAENNVTSNEMLNGQEEANDSNNQFAQQQVERGTTDLVDNLPLPDSYELLASFLGALDQGLNLCHSRQATPVFTTLRRVVENQTQRTFTMNHLKQILHIEPGMFIHHWEQRQNKWELMIQIPGNIDKIYNYRDQGFVASETPAKLPINSSIMRARVAYLRKLMFKMVYEAYENFAATYAHLVKNHDVIKTQRWPGVFDLNHPKFVPDIPLGEIKEQPQQAKKETVQEFINKNDQKVQIKEAMEQAQHQNAQSSENESSQLSDSSEEARRRSMKQSVQTGLKDSTMAVVRMKDQMESKAKIRQQEEDLKQEAQKKLEAHLKTAEQIRSIFQYNQASTMKVRDLVLKIQNGSAGTFTSPQLIRQQIETIQKICHDWLKFIPNVNGTYVKVHKNLQNQQYMIKQKLQNHFNLEHKSVQDAASLQVAQKKRERMDSEQARVSRQVMDKGDESQRQNKSCPPVSQSQEQSNIQQSAQERSYNQSAVSQKSNSLSQRQQENMSSQMNNQQMNSSPNLTNQQQVIRKGGNSAFQPFQKQAPHGGMIHSQSLQSESQLQQMNQHIYQSSTQQNQFVQQQSRGASQVSNTIENSDLPSYQQNQIQPSSNSLFKQVTPQAQRAQVKPYQQPVQQPEQANRNGDNNGSSGTYLTGSCESAKNPEMEGGALNEQYNGNGGDLQKQNNRFAGMNSANSGQGLTNKNFGNLRHQQSGIDSLLRQVMQNGDQQMLNKNFSPVKQQRQQVQQSGPTHQNRYDPNSISANMGVQLGNDLYQGMASGQGSSRGRGYSGSMYGTHKSNTNTHHPSMLAMDAMEDDDDDMQEDNHNAVAAPFGNRYFPVHKPQQRDRIDSIDQEDSRQHFGHLNGGRFGGQRGSYY